MLIDEQFRKCVTFLYVEKNENTHQLQKVPFGTAFFAAVRLGKTPLSALYVVTAGHVVNMSRQYGSLFIRANLKTGDARYLPSNQDNEWVIHHDSDIAVAQFKSSANHDFRFIQSEIFVTNDRFQERPPAGLGDDVFLVGLFGPHPGQKKNRPIVRFGNISMMPEEPISISPGSGDTAHTMRVDAYLVEARSWGGHSGSPAFVCYPPDRKMGKLDLGPRRKLVALLGVVVAHFGISEEVKFEGDIVGRGAVAVNSGMAVVVPASKINELLMLEEFVGQRKVMEAGALPTTPSPFSK